MKKILWYTISLALSFICLNSLAKEKLVYHITGVEQTQVKDNITESLKIIEEKLDKNNINKIPVSNTILDKILRGAEVRTLQAVKPFGYFNAYTQIHATQKNNEIILDINVDLGKPVILTHNHLTIRGAGKNNPYFQKIVDQQKKLLNKPLNTQNYKATKNTLFLLANNNGYFQAQLVESKIYIDLKKKQATIDIEFDTGPVFHFGKTTFSSNRLNDKFLKRFLTYKEGDVYSSNDIAKTQKNLNKSQYFQQVSILPQVNNIKGDTVPIMINLIPASKTQYSAGAGYGSNTGVRGNLSYERNPVNSWGHRFITNIQASELDNNITSTYIIPGKNPATSQYALSAGVGTITQKISSQDNKSVAGKLSVNNIKSWGNLTQTVGLNFLQEKYQLQDIQPTTATMLYPSAQWQYITSNKTINPDYGVMINLQASGTINQLSKFGAFSQLRLSSKALYTFGPTDTRFLVSGMIARTDINEINNLPLSLQLYLGGTQNLRGFTFNEVGPGKNLLFASAEIQQRFYKKFYLAAFYDAGNVTNNSLFDQPLEYSAGPGLVWLSPIGMVELTLGFQLSNKKSNGNYPSRVQLSIGAFLS